MRRRLVLLVVFVAAGWGLAWHPAAACPKGSLMLAGGAPGLPDVCFDLDTLSFYAADHLTGEQQREEEDRDCGDCSSTVVRQHHRHTRAGPGEVRHRPRFARM